MSDYRDRDDHDGDQDELDNQYQMSRDQASDDFANFDPARYLRERRRPSPDAEADEVQLEPYYGRSRFVRADPASAEPAARRGRRDVGRTAGRTALPPQGTQRLRIWERGGGGGLVALLGSFLPGLGPIALLVGCFGIMFIVGICGMGAWFVGQLLNR